MRVYLDNCSTTPVAKEVLEAMLPYFTEKFGHPVFLYSLGQEAADAVDEARATVAGSINAKPDEICFTSGATEANDLAIRGLAYANRKRGDHIITTKVENPSVLRICERLEREGFKVDYVGVDSEGSVDLDELQRSITDRTTVERLVLLISGIAVFVGAIGVANVMTMSVYERKGEIGLLKAAGGATSRSFDCSSWNPSGWGCSAG